jgi:hypothetical protein
MLKLDIDVVVVVVVVVVVASSSFAVVEAYMLELQDRLLGMQIGRHHRPHMIAVKPV